MMGDLWIGQYSRCGLVLADRLNTRFQHQPVVELFDVIQEGTLALERRTPVIKYQMEIHILIGWKGRILWHRRNAAHQMGGDEVGVAFETGAYPFLAHPFYLSCVHGQPFMH